MTPNDAHGSRLASRPVLHVLRVTIEARSPLSVGGGEDASIYDTALLRDANGLPTIQGASLAGALRHRLALNAPEAADLLFGFETEHDLTGSAARLQFSFGRVLDSKGIPVQGLLDEAVITGDELLRHYRLAAPLLRDHVAIDARGVADERKKHMRGAVPRGTRFAFEITMWGTVGEAANDRRHLQLLLGLLSEPTFRLGGATLRGYGQIAIMRTAYRAIDVGVDSPAAVRRLRLSLLGQPSDFEPFAPAAPEHAHAVVTGNLRLNPVGVWRIGQGSTAFVQGESKASAHPLTEPLVEWVDTTGATTGRLRKAATVSDTGHVTFAVPASAIKGALAHRTIYHYRRLAGDMIVVDENGLISGAKPASLAAQADAETTGLDELFGSAKSRDEAARSDTGTGGDRGKAGVLLIDDSEVVVPKSAVIRIEHNSIDRFTGGARGGLLFAEECVLGGDFEVTFRLLRDVSPKLKHAGGLALQDMCQGRMALGATRLGVAAGTVEWDSVG
ncbi:MAG: RAMP superfamily CRISPR-associated protein, partial [Vicinamibacterales bacterium]